MVRLGRGCSKDGTEPEFSETLGMLWAEGDDCADAELAAARGCCHDGGVPLGTELTVAAIALLSTSPPPTWTTSSSLSLSSSSLPGITKPSNDFARLARVAATWGMLGRNSRSLISSE